MTNPPAEIKPCPFCGKEPNYIFCPQEQHGEQDLHCISCEEPKNHYVESTGTTKEQAAIRWNTRAEPAPLPDEVYNALNAIDPWFNSPSGKILRAHISTLEADNKRLRDLLECWDGVSTSHEPTGHQKDCGCHGTGKAGE